MFHDYFLSLQQNILAMSTWDKLSMAERAEIMKLAIQGGVYDLDAIRNGYNKFAGGGAVTNEIAEDYQPLVSDGYQPIMNSMKASNAGFNVDDYAYRVKKLHPEITREQVQSLYNTTPYIASNKVKGVTEGGFRAGDSTGYGRRVTLYPEAHYRNTGTKITPANANAEMGDTMTHETNHLYTDVLLGGTNNAEGDLLWDAYRPGLVVQDPGFNGDYSEERAINAGIRNRISRENGNVTGIELDKAIDNTPDDVLMNMLFDPNNGYINQKGKKHMQDKNGNWNRTDAVRRALKDVAFNNQFVPDNYAALGGPLMQAANEYKHGGSIHIKPENRGKFTRLKERTGHSASWFKEHGTPAQKKMAVFALNSRKWKHGDGGNLFYNEDENLFGLGDWLKKAYNKVHDTATTAVSKGRKFVRDWGLDKSPEQHLMEMMTPTADKKYRQNLYNIIDPTSEIPSGIDIAKYGIAALSAKYGGEYPYRRTKSDSVADAAWAKRLGLEYNQNALIDNGDGTFRLPAELEAEIPTDTLALKERIANNENRLKRVKGGEHQLTREAVDIDKQALEALRKTYSTGEPVMLDEHSHVSRNWQGLTPESDIVTPLNTLHRYTVQYDKDNNRMKYWDWYDFNEFENFVPGNPFKIQGSIDLNKRR